MDYTDLLLILLPNPLPYSSPQLQYPFPGNPKKTATANEQIVDLELFLCFSKSNFSVTFPALYQHTCCSLDLPRTEIQ